MHVQENNDVDRNMAEILFLLKALDLIEDVASNETLFDIIYSIKTRAKHLPEDVPIPERWCDILVKLEERL